MMSINFVFDLFPGNHAHNSSLISYTLENVEYLAVSFDEAKLCVLDSFCLSEFFNQETGCSEVVTWKTREEMMGDLEVKATMEEGQAIGANDVRGSTQLTMDKGFNWT